MSNRLMKAKLGETVRVALISGHTILIGDEPTEVHPQFQREALSLGANFCDGGEEAPADVPPPPPAPDATAEEKEQIKAALILMLERNEEDDFTKAGQPNLRVVRELAGFNAERDEIYNTFAELKAEVAQNGEATVDLS